MEPAQAPSTIGTLRPRGGWHLGPKEAERVALRAQQPRGGGAGPRRAMGPLPGLRAVRAGALELRGGAARGGAARGGAARGGAARGAAAIVPESGLGA